MSRFAFTAIAGDGSTVTGIERADSTGAAHLALVDRGYQPLQLSEKRSILQFEITQKRVPHKDVMHFSRQLAVFVKAGIPILEALEVIANETTNKIFRKALFEMIESLQAGDTFAAAASAHPQAFAPFYIGILNSAELTGDLDVVLNQLSDYIERDADARSKVTSALIYPGVVMAMSIVTVVVLATFVLPRFRVFFNSLHATLPLPTRMLLAFTGDVSKFWYEIAGTLVAIVVALMVARRTTSGRRMLDTLLLKAPVVGDLIQHSIYERVCRILASMITAGVGLPEAMTVTADAINNSVYRKAMNAIREQMIEGQGLAAPLARSGVFPGALRQMFRVGEETGTLDTQLKTAASYYDRELDFKIKRFTSLFEPAVIIFMGVVVGFVAVALVTAMYGIYKQVNVS
jgi:type IV pilus assembly protein PilC